MSRRSVKDTTRYPFERMIGRAALSLVSYASERMDAPPFSKISRNRDGKENRAMAGKQNIEWLEFLADGFSYKAFLKLGMTPAAMIKMAEKRALARGYRNIYWVWRADAGRTK